jgi:hypothetical protein
MSRLLWTLWQKGPSTPPERRGEAGSVWDLASPRSRSNDDSGSHEGWVPRFPPLNDSLIER